MSRAMLFELFTVVTFLLLLNSAAAYPQFRWFYERQAGSPQHSSTIAVPSNSTSTTSTSRSVTVVTPVGSAASTTLTRPPAHSSARPSLPPGGTASGISSAAGAAQSGGSSAISQLITQPASIQPVQTPLSAPGGGGGSAQSQASGGNGGNGGSGGSVAPAPVTNPAGGGSGGSASTQVGGGGGSNGGSGGSPTQAAGQSQSQGQGSGNGGGSPTQTAAQSQGQGGGNGGSSQTGAGGIVVVGGQTQTVGANGGGGASQQTPGPSMTNIGGVTPGQTQSMQGGQGGSSQGGSQPRPTGSDAQTPLFIPSTITFVGQTTNPAGPGYGFVTSTITLESGNGGGGGASESGGNNPTDGSSPSATASHKPAPTVPTTGSPPYNTDLSTGARVGIGIGTAIPVVALLAWASAWCVRQHKGGHQPDGVVVGDSREDLLPGVLTGSNNRSGAFSPGQSTPQSLNSSLANAMVQRSDGEIPGLLIRNGGNTGVG